MYPGLNNKPRKPYTIHFSNRQYAACKKTNCEAVFRAI